jgi:uncharacterized membrane protein
MLEQEERSATGWLLVILAVAVVLRYSYLSRDGIWLDESMSWWVTAADWRRVLQAEVTNPPFYYVLLYPWVGLFGRTEEGLRAFSATFSVISVLLVYLLGRRLFSQRVGLIAAAFQAIATFQIEYAQEARTHALLVSILLTLTLVLWKAAGSGRGERLRWWIAYAVLASVSFYTHFIAFFFVAAHGIFVLLQRRKDLLLWFTAAGAAGVIGFAPWLWQMLETAAGGGQARRYPLLKIPQTYFSFLFGDTLIPLDERAVRNVVGTLKAQVPQLAGAAGAAVLLAPALWGFVRKERRRPELMLAIVMATAPVALALIAWVKIKVLDERYMQTSAPFLYLLLAGAVVEAWNRLRAGGAKWVDAAALAGAALLVGLNLVSLRNYYFNPEFGKEQWREAIPYVESRAAGGRDLVLLEPDYLHLCYQFYRRTETPFERILAPLERQILEGSPELRERLAGYRRVWLIRSHHSDDRIRDALRRMMIEQSVKVYPRGKAIEITEFAPRSAGS